MLATDNTVTGWSDVIAQLTKQHEQDSKRIAELQAEKRSLALEAAMGNVEARKRLDKLNSTLTTLAFDLDNAQMALSQAQEGKKKAEQAVKDAAEQQRQQELGKLATTAVEAAAEFTRAIASAVHAGREARKVLREMTRLARPNETTNINRLCDTASWERAGEFLGLRECIDFPMYKGPKEHLGPLENEFASLLGRWLPNENGKEQL
jgi:chromosome segregation ATPase